MIEPESLIIFAVPWIIYRVIVLIIKKKISLRIEWMKALFYFSMIFIYCLTLFPYPFYVYPYQTGAAMQQINLLPFASIHQSLTHSYYMVPLRNIGGNILLFMPLGFSIPLRFKVKKLGSVILLGLITSCTVEVVQLFATVRSFDVDDLILNTLGTMIGVVFYRLGNQIRKSTKEKEPMIS